MVWLKQRAEYRIVIEVRDENNTAIAQDVVCRLSGPNREALQAEALAIALALTNHVDDEIKYYAERDREES